MRRLVIPVLFLVSIAHAARGGNLLAPPVESLAPFPVLTESDLVDMARTSLELEFANPTKHRPFVLLVDPRFTNGWLPTIPGVEITLLTEEQMRAADKEGSEYYCFVGFVLRRGWVQVDFGHGTSTNIGGTSYEFRRTGSVWVGKPLGQFAGLGP